MTRIGGAGKLFGTDGVRGVANEELTVEMAVNLGRVIATLRNGTIAVGMDARLSSPMFKSAVIAGITSAGCSVVDLGLVPTPALQYYVKCKKDIAGGVVVTASHNPRQYNGIKFIQDDGREFTRSMDEESERLYLSKSYRIVSWDRVGKVYSEDCKRMYIEGVMEKVDVDLIADKKFKVVLDCGNGAGAVTSPELLRRLGCRCIGINSHPDGTFPCRNPEPVKDNVGFLMQCVRDAKADIGIAHDGDADRATFVDERGEFVPEDVMLALMAKHYVEKNGGGIVVTPVSSSKCVEDAVKEAGGKVVYTPVGSPVVAETMLREKAVFGGEGNGGLVFPEHLLARDGAMSLSRVLELMAEEKKKLSELIRDIPTYVTLKAKVPCKDKLKLLEGLKNAFPDADFTDGAKVEYEDGWILIRPSGTEPIARVMAESKSESRARELLEMGINTVKKILT
ncbi:MAG: phosphoglucosamine mutase [Archaeoglobus sp.]|jgi:phosphomannomutase/phosphoglucomutase|nr:MAG: phosphoglucosamine mutase [Archaeoglobus sp.]